MLKVFTDKRYSGFVWHLLFFLYYVLTVASGFGKVTGLTAGILALRIILQLDNWLAPHHTVVRNIKDPAALI